MPDFRIPDTAPENPKLRAAGLGAAGLWGMAGAWCQQPTNLTDGWVPAYWIATWPNGARAARRLVEVGLWAEEQRDGMAGYQYLDWEEFQRTRASIESDRNRAKERMRAVRKRRSTPDSSPERSGELLRNVRPNVQANDPVDNSRVGSESESPQTHRRITADSPENHGSIENNPVDNSTTSADTPIFGRTTTERSPEVHRPPHPHPVVTKGGEVTFPARARDARVREEPPPPRCPEHLNEPTPPPCGKCADARRTNQRWHADEETRRLEFTAALNAAHADPSMRCRHGTDAGLLIRPENGKSATCQHCRAESTRDTA